MVILLYDNFRCSPLAIRNYTYYPALWRFTQFYNTRHRVWRPIVNLIALCNTYQYQTFFKLFIFLTVFVVQRQHSEYSRTFVGYLTYLAAKCKKVGVAQIFKGIKFFIRSSFFICYW